ncbi:MAG: winged helix-turn-helix domain-containing protein [Chloroflexota bacterium]
MTAARTILVVAENPRLVSDLRHALAIDSHDVTSVVERDGAVRRVTESLPDLVLLDEPGPPDSGFDLLSAIRRCSSVPVIILSDRDDAQLKVSALDRGADDYVTRPFGEAELRSRVRAVLRRAEMPAPTPKTMLVVDDYLTIDFGRREVIAGGRHVPLRPTEYRLLYHLVNNAGRVLTHETLLAKVWGYEYRTEEHYVRLYVTYLRQKIESDPRHPRYILNERGMGYRFVELAPAEPVAALMAAT